MVMREEITTVKRPWNGFHGFNTNIMKRIRHARSAEGEKHIPYDVKAGKQLSYLVDRYFVDSKGVEHVLEFNGCWYHGCPRCYPRDTLTINTKSLKLKKEKTLTSMGYIVHSMWPCDFVQEKSVTPPLQEFCLDLNIPEMIDIRDSYFRGCTNGIQLYKMVDDKERIGDVDFCSLYPDVLKYQCYPVGHPTRIVDNFLPLALEKCPGGCHFNPCKGTILENTILWSDKNKNIAFKKIIVSHITHEDQ